MSYRTARSVFADQGLGNLLDDFQQAVAVVQATADGGSITTWLRTRVTQLNQLPAEVRALRSKITNLQAYFGSNGNPATPMTDLAQAQALCDDIDANYPGVQQRVGMVTAALLPILPQLQAGTVDATVLGTIAASGVDLAGTFHDTNAILADYAQAMQLTAQATGDPSLTPAQRAGAQQAGGATLSPLMMVGLAAAALVVVRAVWK